MAQFQSEIELRVKVLDRELDQLEKRIARVANPFTASGGTRNEKRLRAAKQAQKAELNLIQQAVEAEDRLRETKAQKRVQTNIRRVRYLRDQRIKAARDVAQAEKRFQKQIEREQLSRIRKTEAAQRNSQKRRQDILLGAGFPLLFGGGFGQAIAGGVGGAIGGFGGGIAAQAALSGVTQLTQSIAETAAVTTSTAASFEFLTENQLYSSDETRRLADELAELGRVEELAALNTKELVRLIGNEGVENLQALDTEWRELLSNVAELGLAIAAFISKYLEPLIALLNSAVGSINTRNRFESLQGDLKGTPLGAQLEADIKAARQANGRGARSGSLQTSDMEALLKKYLPQRPITAKVPVTDQDRKDFAPPKTSTKAADQLERQLAAGEKLARQFRQRVELLNAESDLEEKLLRITHQREEAAIRIKETTAASQQAALLQQNAELGQLERAKAVADFAEKQVKNADAFLEKLLEQETAERRRKELISQGILPELAKQLAEIEKQAEKLKTNLDLDIATLDAIKAEVEARGGNVEAIEKEIDALKRKKKEIEGAEEKAKGKAEQDSSIQGRLGTAVEKQEAKLKELMDPVNQIVSAADAIGTAFADAFGSIIDGSKSAGEAFGDMAKQIGQYFIDMAMTMIAEYVKLILMQSILNALGGPQMGGGGSGGYSIPDAAVPKTSGMSFFADGGYATRPTAAMIGEGGENEYVIPESKMAGAMARYSSGERGSSVVTPYGGDSEGGTAVADAPMTVTVQGGVTVMDNQEYIRKDQLPSIIDQASKAGETKTLARLRNSPGTRRRIGI